MQATAKTPLLQQFKVPPVFTQKGVEKMSNNAIMKPDAAFPPCSVAIAKPSRYGKKLPQAIAHRGYKAKFPENTMGAFKGAVEIGANAIETDVHITKDDVVVLSHDATLSRCFGQPDKIIEKDWSYISTLKTLKEPQQSMPRLQDLLEYLAQPGLEDVWLLLDIKLDNDSDAIMRLIAQTLDRVSPSTKRPWHSRVILGAWAAKYIPLANHYMPGFPVTHIGFSTTYARQFFKVPNVSFNMLLPILQGPGGRKFIRDVQAINRPILAWTVNQEAKMEWCIRRKLDGVITDDPKLFLEVCDRFDESSPEMRLPISDILDAIRIWFMALFFGFLYRRRFDKLRFAPREGSSS